MTQRRDDDLIRMAIRGRARRRAIGMTTDELARQLGVSRGRVYNLECYGAGNLRVLLRWAEVLGMPARELVFGREETESV